MLILWLSMFSKLIRGLLGLMWIFDLVGILQWKNIFVKSDITNETKAMVSLT